MCNRSGWPLWDDLSWLIYFLPNEPLVFAASKSSSWPTFAIQATTRKPFSLSQTRMQLVSRPPFSVSNGVLVSLSWKCCPFSTILTILYIETRLNTLKQQSLSRPFLMNCTIFNFSEFRDFLKELRFKFTWSTWSIRLMINLNLLCIVSLL